MTTLVKRTSLVALGALLLVAGSARVAVAGDTVVAKIPFAFMVHGMELPAGDYVISRDLTDSMLMTISTKDGHHSTVVLTQPSDTNGENEQPQLKFERVGKIVYLTEVTLGPGEACEVPAPAAH